MGAGKRRNLGMRHRRHGQCHGSILMGYTEDEAEVALRGGKLVIRYDRESGHLFMTGPAVEVFRGSIDIPEEIYYD